MIIHIQSVLETDKTYRIQEVSKFPKKLAHMIGQNCILKQIVGGSVKVQNKGIMREILARSIIKVAGYTAKGVSNKNADGFIVTQQNILGLPILEPEITRNDYIEIQYNNRTIKVPFNILAALVQTKKIEKNIPMERIAEQTGVSPKLVEVCDELLSSHENRKDIADIPAALIKLLPDVNLVVLRDKIRKSEDAWFDLKGNLHATIADAERENTKIRHRELTNALIEMSTVDFKRQAEEIRTMAFA